MTSGERDSSVGGSGDLVFPEDADDVENIAADVESCGGGDATVAEQAGVGDDVDDV